MFISTTSSDYSIMDCPPIRPLLIDTTSKWKSNKIEVAPNCPRCASSNTKFCYYNNYSLSQPRYFCKACRRYWTKGGSLRNVPVGGGCRKTRRARAARQGGGGTISYTGTTLSPRRAEDSTNESIDLAAVFAKYLNPNVENQDQSCSPGASCASSENVQASSLDLDQQIEDFVAFDQNHDQPLDLVNGADDSQLQLMIPPQLSTHEINCQDFGYQNCEMQGILDDHELAGDILWSDVTNFPNFDQSQQSTVQIQDLGLFLPDDQLRISANLVHDNWGSFDLSGYEIFSRP